MNKTTETIKPLTLPETLRHIGADILKFILHPLDEYGPTTIPLNVPAHIEVMEGEKKL